MNKTKMFKFPGKKEALNQILKTNLIGKRAILFFAEYGKEGSNCKYMVESNINDFNIHKYWEPTNIEKKEVIIKDAKCCNISGWFEIFFETITYAGLKIDSAIITNKTLDIIENGD
jgi:hypothetical protein